MYPTEGVLCSHRSTRPLSLNFYYTVGVKRSYLRKLASLKNGGFAHAPVPFYCTEPINDYTDFLLTWFCNQLHLRYLVYYVLMLTKFSVEFFQIHCQRGIQVAEGQPVAPVNIHRAMHSLQRQLWCYPICNSSIHRDSTSCCMHVFCWRLIFYGQ